MFKSTTLSSANIADAITATIGYDQQIDSHLLKIQLKGSSTNNHPFFDAIVLIGQRIICHLESSMIIQALRSWLMIERGYDSTITPSLHLDENNEIFATL